jgi:protein-disulfide isomerase
MPEAKKKTTKKTTRKAAPKKSSAVKTAPAAKASKSSISANTILILIGLLVLSGAVIFAATQMGGRGGSGDFQEDFNEALEEYIESQEAQMREEQEKAQSEREAAAAERKKNIEAKVAEIGMDALADDDPFLGSADAPVTIVEFSDYQCPYCNDFRVGALEKIKSEYVEKGLVKFVYRDLPLRSIHPQAFGIAAAMECIDEQAEDEVYYTMHDEVFENGYSESEFIAKAGEYGVNTQTLKGCIDSGETENEVLADMRAAQELGISGTPAIIVDGQFFSGAYPFSTFQDVIEESLNR